MATSEAEPGASKGAESVGGDDKFENVWDCVAILKAAVIPPFGVFMEKGIECEFWVSVGLTLLGYVPGVIYSVYIVTDSMSHEHQEKLRKQYAASQQGQPDGDNGLASSETKKRGSSFSTSKAEKAE